MILYFLLVYLAVLIILPVRVISYSNFEKVNLNECSGRLVVLKVCDNCMALLLNFGSLKHYSILSFCCQKLNVKTVIFSLPGKVR